MRPWFSFRTVGFGLLGCLLWSPSVSAQVLDSWIEGVAAVEKARIVISVPLPYDGTRRPAEPVPGYFVWRFTVATLQPFSLVVTSDTALRSNVPDQIVRASSVRLCADPLVVSALACTSPVDASLVVASNHFRVVIKEPELLARVRRDGPAWYTRYVVVPGGRFLATYHRFRY